MASIFSPQRAKRGASLVIALMFFLVALTIGALVTTAASAASGRLATVRRQEQDYLAVSSAAILVRDSLSGSRYENGAGDFPVLKSELETLLADPAHAPMQVSITCEGMPEVAGTVQVNAAQTILVDLWLENEDGSRRCPMQVRLTASASGGVTRWPAATVGKGVAP